MDFQIIKNMLCIYRTMVIVKTLMSAQAVINALRYVTMKWDGSDARVDLAFFLPKTRLTVSVSGQMR